MVSHYDRISGEGDETRFQTTDVYRCRYVDSSGMAAGLVGNGWMAVHQEFTVGVFALEADGMPLIVVNFVFAHEQSRTTSTIKGEVHLI